MLLDNYLYQMAWFYALTVAVEAPVLYFGLSSRHGAGVRLFSGVWLTACTYPLVWLFLPGLMSDRALYLGVAETMAPVFECGLFWAAFVRPLDRADRATVRDFAVIVAANLASFGVGEVVHAFRAGWQ